jgi:signal transduction histidine kinase
MTDKSILSAKELTLISHKLRTPLSIINGYSEAVLSQADKENFSPFTSKALEEINKQGNRMSILVDKLMAFNQVFATNEAQVEKQPIELKNLIKSCAPRAIDRAGETTPSKKANGTKYGTFVEIDCANQLSLLANPDMVRLAVEELLENAIKFNNKLEKIIKVQVANHGDSISISVRDYGVGIRPQDVSLIFEPFYQVDDYFTGQVNGWGLGLPMVQRILNLHKGSISVVSDRGLGSIFTLSFPL